MLDVAKAVLVVIDVQGKLAQLMADKETMFRNLQRMILGARALSVPILLVEQNPARLGATTPELARLLPGVEPIPKTSFSCAGNPRFMAALEQSSRSQVLVAGIEAHVCVYQSAVHLVEAGYTVEVVVDAVGSRSADNKALGLRKMAAAGVGLSSTEMALFELMGDCEHPAFREIQGLIK
ncbi:MAG: hydrolase [Halioglobus sp.]|nr:hydrolase [Halioglobus sp.]